MNSPSRPPDLTIDVVSDVVCPWCYLGKARLDAALAQLPELTVAVRWRPYQLDPTVPQGGVPRADYIARKFGSESRIEAAHRRLTQLGSAAGITYRFDAITWQPNTVDAHRLVHWAADAGVEEAAVTRLFELEFRDGANVGDHAVLVALAREIGLDAGAVARKLADGTDADLVRAEAQRWTEMGVTGVPCFVLNGKYAVMGAQETATLVQSIRQVAATAMAEKAAPVAG